MNNPRPHTIPATAADGTRHLVNEQCRFVRDAEGRQTLRGECGQDFVYTPDENHTQDCPDCWRAHK